MGLILKQGKGRRSPRGPVFMKGACSLQGRRSLALHVFILISHRPRYSRSITIDKCPRLELKLLDLLVAIIPPARHSSLLLPPRSTVQSGSPCFRQSCKQIPSCLCLRLRFMLVFFVIGCNVFLGVSQKMDCPHRLACSCGAAHCEHDITCHILFMMQQLVPTK